MKKTQILWNRIHVVDKCLILIMFILLLQTSYNLFANECMNQNTSSVDIIVRTSIASIFGYFISVNFMRRQKNTESNTPDIKMLSVNEAEENLENTDDNQQIGNIQILIITGVGVLALLILLLARNFAYITDEAVGTVSQLRDLVSGCVGFLIGCPTDKKSN